MLFGNQKEQLRHLQKFNDNRNQGIISMYICKT